MKSSGGIGWFSQVPRGTAEPGWMAARKSFLSSSPAEKRAESSTGGSTNGLKVGLQADARASRGSLEMRGCSAPKKHRNKATACSAPVWRPGTATLRLSALEPPPRRSKLEHQSPLLNLIA